MYNVVVLCYSTLACNETYGMYIEHFEKLGLRVTKESRFQKYIEVMGKFHITFRSEDHESTFKGLRADIVIGGTYISHKLHIFRGDINGELFNINSLRSLTAFVIKTLKEGEENDKETSY